MRDAQASSGRNPGQGGRLGSVGHPFGARGASSGIAFSAAASIRRAAQLAGPTFAATFLTIGVAALLSAATATADTSIGRGVIGASEGVAVSKKEGNNLYLAPGSTQRVVEIHPDGSFARAFGWSIDLGAAEGTGNLITGQNLITGVSTSTGAFLRNQVLTGPGIPPNTKILAVGKEEGSELSGAELRLSEPVTATATNSPLIVNAAPGNVPVNEQQTLTVTATGGEFTLRFTSPFPEKATEITTRIPAGAPATGSGSVQEALENLPDIGSGNVTVSEGPGDETGSTPYLIEFKGHYADVNVNQLVPGNVDLTGGTPSSSATVATTQGGAASLESCTSQSLCSSGESGAGPGQFNWSDEIAVDNDPSSPSYGDVYVVDQRNYRVEKYSSDGELLLMIGGEVDKTSGADVCTAADIAGGDVCGAGVPGTGPSRFYRSPVTIFGSSVEQGWNEDGNNSITVAPDGTVWVGDFRRVQHFDSDGSFLGELILPNSTDVTFAKSIAVTGAGDVYANTVGVNERQKVNLPATGEYELTFEGQTTTPLSAIANENTVRAALEALTTIGAGNVAVEMYGPLLQVSFKGPLANQNLPQMTATNATVETLRDGGESELVKIGAANELLQTLDPGGEPVVVALDASGDLYLSDLSGGEKPLLRGYLPDGSLFAEFSTEEITPFTPHEGYPAVITGLAVGDAEGVLYATAGAPEGAHIAVMPLPTSGAPAVSEEEATDIEPSTATLRATVNPRGFDTEYHFEYVDQESFEDEGGFSSVHTQSTGSVDVGTINRKDKVFAAISGLTPGTLYHWRVVAKSTTGTTYGPEEFDTLTAISVRNLTTQTVGPELVRLKAELNPNTSASTYTLRYGNNAAYACEQGNTCAVSGNLPVGNEFEPIEAEFTGLKPNTLYHYQIEAENSYGRTETFDKSFTTEPSSSEERAAESCGNTNLREENNSLALPDCRAYEQTTPTDKKGGEAFPSLNFSPSGEDVYYFSEGSFGGATGNQLVIPYFAHRTNEGWVSEAMVRRPLPSPTEALLDPGLDFTPEMNKWLFLESPGLYAEEAAFETQSIFYSLGAQDGSTVPEATPTFRLVEGSATEAYEVAPVTAASEDLSHLFLLTGHRLFESPTDPRPESGSVKTRIYEVSGVGGPNPVAKLAAEVPLGLTKKDGGRGNCQINGEETEATSLNPRLTSADGSVLFYSAPVELVAGADCGERKPNQVGLFARFGESPPIRLNTPPPSQCSSPSPCASGAFVNALYDGANAEGTRVWFTTTQPLINADHDTENDLYIAKLEHEELSELELASAGEATTSHPTPGQGADVGEEGVGYNTAGAIDQGAVQIAPGGRRGAFESAAVLTNNENGLHQVAVKGANNLYIYDEPTGETKFVTELCSGPGLSGTDRPEIETDFRYNVNAKPSYAVPDPACPSTVEPEVGFAGPCAFNNDDILWMFHCSGGEVKFSENGRYLFFTSMGRLTPDDTDDVRDIYRYDFNTGALQRISFGRNGNDANGNDDAYPAYFAVDQGLGSGRNPSGLAEDASRSISTDGSVVVFSTEAPLVSHDTNEAEDVYEWEEEGAGTCHESGGCIRLISDGVAPHGSSAGIISSSGRDIAFQTLRDLIPADTDGVGDIYDARSEGGFHTPQVPSPCGNPAGCRAGSEPSPAAPVVGSETFVGSGNSKSHLSCAKGKHRGKRHGQVRCVKNRHRTHHKKKRKRHHMRSRRRAGVDRGGNK